MQNQTDAAVRLRLFFIGRQSEGALPCKWLAGWCKRADVGSELSAASGGCSEVSEWQRSKFTASAVRQRRNFGHCNRAIGPYARGEARCGGRWRLPGGGIGCGLIGAAQKQCTGSDFREIVLCITQ